MKNFLKSPDSAISLKKTNLPTGIFKKNCPYKHSLSFLQLLLCEKMSRKIEKRSSIFILMKEVYNKNQQNKGTRMKGSQKYRKYRKFRLKKKNFTFKQLKIQGYRITHPTISSVEENTKNNRPNFNLSNIQIFKQQTQSIADQYPSSFQLIRSLPHHPAKNMDLHILLEPSFPTLMYKVKDLISFSAQLLETVNFKPYAINRKYLHSLVQTLALHYNSVSYHNFSHAFSLSLLNYHCMIKAPDFRRLYTDQEYFYVLVAGFAHDLNHKGTNNSFEVKSESALAKQYKNVSVLQNMHISTLWNILQQNPEINFLKLATNPAQAKHIITKLILSTDMAYHGNNMLEMKQKREKGQDIASQSQKWFMMEQLFHACDIGNPTYEFDNYITWAALLSYQFNEQAELEKSRNLEVTSFLVYRDLSNLYKDQIWFLGTVVQPMWREISLRWPGLEDLVESIENNKRRIEAEIQLLKK